jgi:hypothetical protein
MSGFPGAKSDLLFPPLSGLARALSAVFQYGLRLAVPTVKLNGDRSVNNACT